MSARLIGVADDRGWSLTSSVLPIIQRDKVPLSRRSDDRRDHTPETSRDILAAPGPIVTYRYARTQSGHTAAFLKIHRSLYRHERFALPVPGIALRRRAVQHGLCRFLHLPDPALRPVAWVRCLRGRHPRRCSLSRRHVPGDPYRRFDGPVRYAQSHAVLCLDGDGFGAPVSAGAVVLALIAAATDQRRRRLFRRSGA